MFDKLKFWKKNDDFGDLDIDKELGLDQENTLGLEAEKQEDTFQRPRMPKAFEEEKNTMNTPFEAPRVQPQPIQQPVADNSIQKDMEIISAKLDALRSTMEAINHRLNSLEQKDKRW